MKNMLKATEDRGMMLMLLFFGASLIDDGHEYFRQDKPEKMIGVGIYALFFIRSVYGRADWDGRHGCPR